jgi:hypothetical protein
MTEQQQHLKNLIEQGVNLEQQLNKNRELFWKVQGAIEYLAQIGVTLPEPEPVSETEVVEEESTEVVEEES